MSTLPGTGLRVVAPVGSDDTSPHDLGPKMEATEPSKSEKASSASLPPEEGLQGWLVCLGAFLALLATFGFLNVIGIFQNTYQLTTLKDYSPSSIAWIFAIQLCLMWAPGPLYGRVIDSYGPAFVMWPGAVLCILGLGTTSVSTEYYQIFLAQGLAFGIGAGAVFTGAFACVGQWFVRRRGLAVGIASVGSSLGGVIFPPFFLRVQAQVGFDGAVRYITLFVGILLAASLLLVKPRLPRRPWNKKAAWFDFTLFKNETFAFFTIGSFFGMWGLWAPFGFITVSAVASGFSLSLATYLISIINATSIFGRIIPPYLSDTFGHLNIDAASALLSGISILALWLPFDFHHSVPGIIVFSLVFGFVSGAYVSLVVASVVKLGDLQTLGQRLGTYQLIVGVATLTGLPIQGAILSRQQDKQFWGMQTHAIICLFLSAVLTGLAARSLGKKLGTWKV